MSVNNLTPKVRTKAKKVLNLAVKSKRSMKLNEMNFVRTSTFIRKESKRISQPVIDKRKLKKLLKTDFASIASANLPGRGGGGLLGLLGDLLGFGGGGGRGGRGGRRGGPPSRRAQQRYRRRFGNRAGNRRFGRMPQFGRGGGVRIPRAGGVLGVAMAGLEYGGRVSEGQTQTQAITGTAASTAGGIAGAYAGAKGGALLGAGIGALFGGVGAVPGAAIGGFLGGIAGGFGGSMLAGGAADRLTGVVGKDKASEEAEKELEKKSKINPLEMTLDKFDQVVNRFAKVIVNLDLSGGRIEESEDEPPKRGDFPMGRSGGKAYSESKKKYRKRQEERKAAIQEALNFEENQLKKRQQESARVKTREQADKAGFGILEGIIGEGAYDSLMQSVYPELQVQEPDATTKFLTNLGISPEAQGISAMLIETVLSAALMARGRGLMKPPAVKTRPLTKPTALQGPELPPVQRQAVSKPRVVRSADTLPRPEVKPTEPMVRQPAQTVQEVLGRGRRSRVRNTNARLNERDNRSQAELDAARDMAEGGLRKSGPKVKPQQNLVEGQTTVEDGSTVFFRRIGGRSGAASRKKLKPTETSSGTQTDGGTQVMSRKDPVDRIKEAQLENIRRANEQGQRDLEIFKETQKKIQPPKPIEQASINQYTTYNAPNNTTIIMQDGGGQMPPQSPPPQMMASAPPPSIPPGPSAIDVATQLNTVIFLNNLQTT